MSDVIPVTCPTCGYRFKVHARYAGMTGRCPDAECGGEYVVPTSDVAEQKTQVDGVPAARTRARRVRIPQTVDRTSVAPKAASPRRGSTAASSPVSPQTSDVADEPSRREAPARRTGRRIVAGATAAVGLLVLAALWSVLPSSRTGASEAEAAETKTAKSDVAARIAERDQRLNARFREHVKPFVTKHCLDCHGDPEGEGGLDFHAYDDVASVRAEREKWNKVVSMLEIRAMPPADHDVQPKAEDRERVLAWLGEALSADCSLEHDPGRVTIRRLNRNEYDNTIRDLVGVDFQPADDFPSDDVGEGFDNIADVLTLPPLLLEKYVSAAEKVAEAAIDARAYEPFRLVLDADALATRRVRDTNDEGFLVLSTEGELGEEIELPRGGRYTFRIEAGADQAGDENARFELVVGDRTLETFEVEGQRRPRFHETTAEVEGGEQRVSVRFLNDFYDEDARDRDRRDRNLHVRAVEIVGGADPRPEDLAETHRRIVIARPEDGLSVREAAFRVLRPFTRRAFRRPVEDDEVARYVGLVEMVVEKGDGYERGLQVAMTGVLVSPHFLFRIEQDRRPDDPDSMRDLSDWELASRLSYFLWSTMPDEELFRLAEEGRLHEPDVLEAQVRRMLADQRSRALVENFGGQWLNLGLLDGMRPDPDVFRRFDDRLKRDMQRESLAFFEWVLREDRSVLDFLVAKTAFVNERLAEHYGIEGVDGDELRPVSLEGLPRAGVLTQGSILMLTSNPDRTSPVKRGKWIMENILGTPPPEAPPDVPALEETAKSNPDLALREQLELHRSNPACRSCHEQMDALGFGFENFDAIGRYRTRAGEHEVDASGVLPSGKAFDGPTELIAILETQRDLFARNLTRKMLTYALGRGLEYYDECAVREITTRLAADEHRFSRLVLEIVRSDPFLKRRGDDS